MRAGDRRACQLIAAQIDYAASQARSRPRDLPANNGPVRNCRAFLRAAGGARARRARRRVRAGSRACPTRLSPRRHRRCVRRMPARCHSCLPRSRSRSLSAPRARWTRRSGHCPAGAGRPSSRSRCGRAGSRSLRRVSPGSRPRTRRGGAFRHRICARRAHDRT
jgi:hypothetical protein